MPDYMDMGQRWCRYCEEKEEDPHKDSCPISMSKDDKEIDINFSLQYRLTAMVFAGYLVEAGKDFRSWKNDEGGCGFRVYKTQGYKISERVIAALHESGDGGAPQRPQIIDDVPDPDTHHRLVPLRHRWYKLTCWFGVYHFSHLSSTCYYCGRSMKHIHKINTYTVPDYSIPSRDPFKRGPRETIIGGRD